MDILKVNPKASMYTNIKASLRAGESPKQVAAFFGVSEILVERVANLVRVTDEEPYKNDTQSN